MRKLIAVGLDARGRGYNLYDYGEGGISPKTVNEYPNENSYRYWCDYEGRTFACSNDREYIIHVMRNATENSRYYDKKGCFRMVE